MNNHTIENTDPILDWILQGNLTQDGNNALTPELLNLLLTQNTTIPTQLPAQDSACPQPSNTQANISSPSEGEEEITDAQLKMMPPKERRQLRNKISARNFRNRRKEYISTLEKEMNEHKEENSRLKLEVKWVRGMMDKLQVENDRLRLELVLCKEGIKPSQCGQPILETPPESVSPSLNLIDNNNTLTNDKWELAPSSNANDSNSIVSNDVYLAHARLPDWDLTDIFDKNNKAVLSMQGPELMKTYPLLAPALMSIVVNHTLTMTTEQIIANSILTDPTPWPKQNKAANIAFSESALWQQMLQSQNQQGEKTSVDTNKLTPHTPKVNEETFKEWFIDNYCPLAWAQKQFCKFVIKYLAVKYPHIETKCRTYLPICKKFRLQSSPQPAC